ncbi:MAG: GNAT family N-acetyltransferase [Alphaproteobacteria bacterium]|nr:GNAT family N-acetyltransferase [Alphaproteobacteria bacterium]
MNDLIPTLTTERLCLRAPLPADLDALSAIRADERVGRTVGGTRTRQEVWFTILRAYGLWHLFGFGYWSVCLRDTGDVVGEVGFADFKRALEPDISGTPEAGWIIANAHWGQGFASEAVVRAHAWLDQHHAGRSTCIINPDNVASIKVAKRVGYHQFCETRLGDSDILMFERNSPNTENR